MRAVWSFWSKPFLDHYHSNWLDDAHHLMSWALSVQTARRHFPETMLVTDQAGADMLIEKLGLRFDQVSTALDALAGSDPGWFALGKLYAYRMQDRPFLHIDGDAYLWKPLPAHVREAELIVQYPEAPLLDFGYHPEDIDALIGSGGGWLPAAWRWYRSSGRAEVALNCGVMGGHGLELIRSYADSAILMVEHPRNRPGWSRVNPAAGFNHHVEQYFLGAHVAYHGAHRPALAAEPRLASLFESADAAKDEANAARIGFTHIHGGSKSNLELMRRLESRVRRDHPALFARCVNGHARAGASPARGVSGGAP
jgi:hypothetical protein